MQRLPRIIWLYWRNNNNPALFSKINISLTDSLCLFFFQNNMFVHHSVHTIWSLICFWNMRLCCGKTTHVSTLTVFIMLLNTHNGLILLVLRGTINAGSSQCLRRSTFHSSPTTDKTMQMCSELGLQLIPTLILCDMVLPQLQRLTTLPQKRKNSDGAHC